MKDQSTVFPGDANQLNDSDMEAVSGGNAWLIAIAVEVGYDLVKAAANAVYDWSTKADHDPYTRD
jgi:hypothetical protein